MIDELAAKVPPSAAQNVGRSPIRRNHGGTRFPVRIHEEYALVLTLG